MKPDPDATRDPNDTESLLVRLRQEHALLDAQVEMFNRRVYLGAREQMERKRLQKMKLLAKDRISEIEARSAP